MSFIRCTSNPEGLYVYDSTQGFIVLELTGKPYTRLCISRRTWGALKRSYRNHPHANFKGRDLEVTHDVSVTLRDREVNTDGWSFQRLQRHNINLKTCIRVVGSNMPALYLWRVTYHYLMRNAVETN